MSYTHLLSQKTDFHSQALIDCVMATVGRLNSLMIKHAQKE